LPIDTLANTADDYRQRLSFVRGTRDLKRLQIDEGYCKEGLVRLVDNGGGDDDSQPEDPLTFYSGTSDQPYLHISTAIKPNLIAYKSQFRELICVNHTFYQRGKLIGRGGNGSVYEGIRITDGKKVALKYTLFTENDKTKRFTNEVDCLTQLKGCKGVMQYIDSCITETQGLMIDETVFASVIISEYYQQTLKHFVDKTTGLLEPIQIISILKSILAAVKLCHIRQIYHLDLNVKNIMLQHSNDINSVVIIDFGNAQRGTDHTRVESLTLPYAPPDVDRKDIIKPRVDSWAIGVILYYLVYKCLPWNSAHTTMIARMNHIQKSEPEYDNTISERNILNIPIQGLLKKDQNERWTIDDTIHWTTTRSF
jgi:serine/threonine protein kinase